MISNISQLIGLLSLLFPAPQAPKIELPTLKGKFTLEYDVIMTRIDSREFVEERLARSRESYLRVLKNGVPPTNEQVAREIERSRTAMLKELNEFGCERKFANRVTISSDGDTLLVKVTYHAPVPKKLDPSLCWATIINKKGMLDCSEDSKITLKTLATASLYGLPYIGVTFPVLPMQSGDQFLIPGALGDTRPIYWPGVLKRSAGADNGDLDSLTLFRDGVAHQDYVFSDFRTLNGVRVAGHVVNRSYYRRDGSKVDGMIIMSSDFKLTKITSSPLPKLAYSPKTYFRKIKIIEP